MTKALPPAPRGTDILWHIQMRLRALGYAVTADGALPQPLRYNDSETLQAVLRHLGGPVPVAVLAPPPARPGNVPLVHIDVGHGNKPRGFDPGAVHAPSRTTEHSLNVIGANACAAALRAIGVDVRIEDGSMENGDAGRRGRGADVFVSFHHNAAANPAQYALALYDTHARPADKALAAAAAAALAAELGIKNQGARQMGLSVLTGAIGAGVPAAILVEPYFIHAQAPDNPPAAQMADWSRRAGQAVARAIAAHLGR